MNDLTYAGWPVFSGEPDRENQMKISFKSSLYWLKCTQKPLSLNLCEFNQAQPIWTWKLSANHKLRRWKEMFDCLSLSVCVCVWDISMSDFYR